MVEIAKIIVSKTTGHCLLRRRIPARAKKAVCVSVEFDDLVWDGLVKTVVFRGNGKKIAEFDGEIAVVPWEVLENPGPQLWFGIWGSNPETGLQLPLIEVRIGPIEESTDPEADPGTDPTLPIWAQLKQDVEELKKGGAGGGGAQSDWNANKGEPGHILNRTHWTESGNATTFLPECTLAIDAEDQMAFVTDAVPDFVVGDSYTVNWNGVEYICTAQEVNEGDMTAQAIGNLSALVGGENTGEPFIIVRYPDTVATDNGVYLAVLPLDGSSSVTISILGGAREIVHKLDNKYLNVDWLPGIEKKDILPLQTVETTDTSDQEYYFVYVPYDGAEVYNGQEITVEINGVPHECVVAGDSMDGFMAMAGGVRLTFYSERIVVMTTGSRTLTLRIYIPKHTKMPAEYLPDEVGTVKTVNGIEPDENGNVEITIPDSGGNVAYDKAQNLTDEQKVQARENIGAQPAGNYLESTELTTAINTALAQAKKSGEFDGEPGYTPVKGVDYFDGEDGKDGVVAVTGATVGQTVKISAVDENGVPTAWESVNFPSGGGGNGETANGWKVVADLKDFQVDTWIPTAYDPETGYFTVQNHGIGGNTNCLFTVSNDATVDEIRNLSKALYALNTNYGRTKIYPNDADTIQIMTNWTTAPIVGDLGIDVEKIRIYRYTEGITISGLGDPSRVRLTIMNCKFWENLHIGNSSMGGNRAPFGVVNFAAFSGGLYIQGSVAGTAGLQSIGTIWEMSLIEKKYLVHHGHYWANEVKNGTDQSKSFIFHSTTQTNSEKYDLNEFRISGIFAHPDLRIIVEVIE